MVLSFKNIQEAIGGGKLSFSILKLGLSIYVDLYSFLFFFLKNLLYFIVVVILVEFEDGSGCSCV